MFREPGDLVRQDANLHWSIPVGSIHGMSGYGITACGAKRPVTSMYVPWDETDIPHQRVQVLRPGADILDEDDPSSDLQCLKKHAFFMNRRTNFADHANARG